MGALTVLALAGALSVIYYEKFLSAPAGLPGALRRRGLLVGLFSLLGLLALALTVFTANAQSNMPTDVPSDWALIPSGLSNGDEFRLLFITSGTRNAESSNISTYNTFVQNAAADAIVGDDDPTPIRAYSSGFRVVGSTEDDDARDNTATTYTADDQGVPIYWLGGNRLADDYADFYDGTWDAEINATNASGGSRPFDSSNTGNRPFTGSDHDGTGDNPNQLGRSNVRVGRPDSGSDRGPISSQFNTARNSPRPFYGLSAVLRVEGEFTPALSIGDDAAGDEGGNVTFTVALSPVAAEVVTATWTASVESGDTAALADDLASATGTLTVRAGEAMGTFTVPTAQDATDEEKETFTVTLSGVSENALIEKATAQGTINDDDEPPVLSVTAVDSEVIEGESATFTVTLAPASGQIVTVLALSGTDESFDHTATRGKDYAIYEEVLAFEPGEISKTVTLATTDDELDEADEETFGLSVAFPTNATLAGGSLVSTLGTTVTISDNDDLPTLSVVDVSAEEGDGLTFTVTLSAVSGRDVTVDWEAATLDAEDGTDYTAGSGTLTFTPADVAVFDEFGSFVSHTPGEARKTFTVATTEDADEEENETFTVTLSNASNASIAEATAKGTIRNDDATLGALPALAQAQTVVRGPYLQSGTSSSVIIKWRTDEATDSVVHYGLDPDSLTLSATNSTSTTEHAVQLTGLSADVQYFYSVGTSSVTLAGGDRDHFVVTAPVPGTAKPPRIWVIGDSGTADNNARAVRDAFLNFTESRHPDLWIMLGDNAYDDGTDNEYRKAVFNTYPQVLPRTVLWPTLGNHDGYTADSTTESGPYYDIFSLPRNGEAGGVASGTEAYYSFDYGNMHFICLDSYGTDHSPDGAMMTWLEADLAANDKEWVIAFWHHPPYSKGSADSDEQWRSINLRQNAVPILEQYGVDLVLTGHSHSYERSYLIDGHYELSDTFTDAMEKNPGDGSATGDGTYQKTAAVGAPHAGAVYVVAGTAGLVKPGGSLDHPAMAVSIRTLGSMVLDVNGSRLDAMFLDSTGTIRDDFTILKVLNVAPTFDSPAAFYAAENQTAAGTVRASDGNSEDDITGYAITGGADRSFFSIGATSGELTFKTAPNFEDAQDQDTGNDYVVEVQATSGTGTREKTATQTITVTVSPSAISGNGSVPPPPKNVRAVKEKGGVRLTWQPPDGSAVTGYRIERRRGAGHASGPQRSAGGPGEHHTLVEDTGSADTGYTDESAEKGVEYEYRVSARNEAGPGEASPWVTAGPAPVSNSPATGAPTVRGTVQVGETLTAGITGIADADGLENVTFSYQWLADGTAISGAMANTYTLVETDEDQTVKVRVSFTDDAGNAESLTSAATAPVAAKPNSSATGSPTISGTAQVGEMLTADTSGIADTDGLTNVSFNYQWLADDGTTDTEITDATAQIYTPSDADAGKSIKVRVSFVDDAGNEETLTGASTDTIVTWSATLTVGEDTSVIPKTSGYSAWGMDGTLSTDTLTQGGATYRVQVLGHQSDGLVLVVERKLQADFTLGIGDAQYQRRDGARPSTMFTDAYWWEAPDLNWSAGDAVEVSLTLVPGAGAPLPELPLAPPTAWFRLAPENHNGVDAFTFRLHFSEDIATDREAFRDHSFEVTGGSVTGVERVNGLNRLWEITVAPDPTGDVTIALPAGVACEVPGAICTADGRRLHNRPEFTVPGTDAGNAESPAGELTPVWSATMTVEWVHWGYGYYATDAKKVGSLSPASFEVDGTTYTVTMIETAGWMYIGTDRELPFGFVLELDGTRFASADASYQSYSYGHIYQWRATGLGWSTGDTVKIRLLPTAPDGRATGAPTISGPALVGETLTADTSGIADPDGLSGASFAYQWMARGRDIDGADGPSLTLTRNEVGRTIQVRVSFTDHAGNRESLTSEPTAAVVARPNSRATGAPTVSGPALVGETLTADGSGIADPDGLADASFVYQWMADDAEIAGATGFSYTLTLNELGRAIAVRVSFTDDAGYRESLASEATAAVAVGPNHPATGAPFISGMARVNHVLRAHTSGIADADGLDNASVAYQWMAGGANIDGANGPSLTLTSNEQEQAIRVWVSFTDAAGYTESLESSSTTTVRPANPCPGTGSGPTPVSVDVGAVPIVVESTTDKYYVLYVRHELDADTTVEIPVSVTLGQAGTRTLTEQLSALPAERYRVDEYLVADPGDVDGDCIDDVTELQDLGGMNPLNPAPRVRAVDGAVAIPDRETFEALSYQGTRVFIDTHLRDLEFVKLYLFGMDTDRPVVYFMNTETHRAHTDFANVIGLWGNPTWLQGAVKGEIVYHPNVVAPDGSLGVYRFEFEPQDAYSFEAVAYAYEVLAASMPLLDDNLAYYPMPASALPLYHEERALYDGSRVNVLLEEDVFPDIDYIALNRAEGYGFLRVMSLEDRPNPRDVVVYETLPNELSRVAGIITSVPQTPLSHVNLRAVQDGVPNAFIRDALDNADVDDLIDSYVHYTVADSGWTLRAATPAEVDAHYAAARPAQPQTPQRDLTVTQITALGDIEFGDWTAFGVKAANVAVLGTLGFPEGTVPDGFAAPFYFYDEFMKHNGLYDDIEEMLADPEFQSDFDTQQDKLKKLRKKIKKADTPQWIIEALEGMHATYPEGQSLRYRSSTNNEDLPGFSGAGLYDSKTQDPEETEEDGIDKSIKGVWASLWNFRAFTEREFHRIDHLVAAMGVLVHPNYSDELANGVAVSFDPFGRRDGSYYVNTQLGEDLVTNPEAHSVPEEMLLHPDGAYTVTARSNQVPAGQLLMSDAQLGQLRRHLDAIHDEFEELYGIGSDEEFAMEIEFKITSENILSIKQARPWVFSVPSSESAANNPATGAPTISGTAQVGKTLMADTMGIADEDGLTNVSYTYQWMADEADISGATGISYTLVQTDESKAITVQIGFTDDRGNQETLTSSATAAVVVAPTPNSPATGAPTITGTAQVGQTLIADTLDIADADGLSSVQYEYQWLADDAEIAGATGFSYTLTLNERGKAIAVRVSFTDDAGYRESLTSLSSKPVRPARPCGGVVSGPTPTPVEVEAVPVVVESTIKKYYVLYVLHHLDSRTAVEIPVSVTLGEAGSTTLAEQLWPLPADRYRVEEYLVADPGDVDGDCIDDVTELAELGAMNPLNPGQAVRLVDGAVAVPDRETFEALSYHGPDPWTETHLIDLEYVKVTLFGMATDRPVVYYQNTETHRAHHLFGYVIEPWIQQNLAFLGGDSVRMDAVIVYHPNVVAPDGSLGVYRFEFQPQGNYSFDAVAYAHEILAASMPLLEGNLMYYPIPGPALQRYHEELALYDESRIRVLLEEDIFPDVDYIALNEAEGYGFLRVMSLEDRPNPRDVVIYETLPNELSRVAGIITSVPQTPLSHVNLRAVQDGVPNAFIRDALGNDDIDDLIDSYVHYTVDGGGWTLRAATPAEVDAHYAASRPAQPQTPQRDLTVTQITALSDIEFGDWTAFGVKAANVAVLGTLGFPEGTVPDGFAAPFYFYDEFMKHNGFYDDVEEMLADPEFQSDFDTQEKELKKLRKKIKKGDTPEWIIEALEGMHATYPEGQSLRYRSSTNNEDLPGFSGAGLYDSKTQDPEETEEDGIDKSIKGVWASLWNFRAFTEREFHRIDHAAAAMGVLVHPNYSDELANGVAVSFDPFGRRDGSYYVNTQLGEDLVTNPEAHSVPEEMLLHPDGAYTVTARSNQVPAGQLLMSDAQLGQLRRHLDAIHDEFEELYGIGSGEEFAMEIEFKITSDNVLSIKQARPWVFSDGQASNGVERAPREHSNRPATGAPTISGTAQVGETLTADTSGIADADGLESASFAYQWLADDADIAGATGLTYTLAAADEGKAIRVRVSFTDDAGNDETLTSEATDAVAAAEPSGPPARPSSLTSQVSHDTVTLTWTDPGDDSITGYVILRRDKDIHQEGTFVPVAPDTGTAETTYTDASVEPEKRYVYRIEAINAHGLSDRSSWVRADTPAVPDPALEVPARPTGLATAMAPDTVTLSWDNPDDDSITGYVILRRDKDLQPEEGTFFTVVSDTGTAATTYADQTVEADKRYVYRIKAINANGMSEISSWAWGYTPAE